MPTARGGSSPLTRGKRLDGPEGALDAGLIPAHAGKTVAKPVAAGAIRAHPRSRGENWQPGVPVGNVLGLIPAHAGKTGAEHRTGVRGRAHPRSRGENLRSISARASARGSSPLTRGKPTRPAARTRGPGLIPAHAGKTAVCMASMRREPAHPRSRGENAGSVR